MISAHLLCLAVAGVAFQGIAAQTSLYIPGFDPQPVSASVVGVGSDGRTTWALAQGQPSGTLTDEEIIGTMTLVEGPNDANLVISNAAEYISEACTINNGIADCTVIATAQGSSTSLVMQETVAPFPVQVGGSSPAQPTAGGSPSAPASSPTASSPQSPSTPSQSSGGASPSPSTSANQPSGAGVLSSSLVFSRVAMLIVSLSLL